MFHIRRIHPVEFFTDDIRCTQAGRTGIHNPGTHPSQAQGKGLPGTRARQIGRGDHHTHGRKITAQHPPRGVHVEQALRGMRHIAVTPADNRYCVTRQKFYICQHSFIIGVPEYKNIGILRDHPDRIVKGLILCCRRTDQRVGLRQYVATKTVHGRLMAEPGSGAGLEKQSTQDPVPKQFQTASPVRLEHFRC